MSTRKRCRGGTIAQPSILTWGRKKSKAMASSTTTSTTPFIIGMRDAYFDALYDIFKKDKNAVFITADNGAPTLDKFASDFPDQYYQVGIAEQQMFGLAAGMAVEGR